MPSVSKNLAVSESQYFLPESLTKKPLFYFFYLVQNDEKKGCHLGFYSEAYHLLIVQEIKLI